jgi:hypothetical protein
LYRQEFFFNQIIHFILSPGGGSFIVFDGPVYCPATPSQTYFEAGSPT